MTSVTTTVNDSELKSVVATDDGGYIYVGTSTATTLGFDNNGNGDAIIVKYDNIEINKGLKVLVERNMIHLIL